MLDRNILLYQTNSINILIKYWRRNSKIQIKCQIFVYFDKHTLSYTWIQVIEILVGKYLIIIFRIAQVRGMETQEKKTERLKDIKKDDGKVNREVQVEGKNADIHQENQDQDQQEKKEKKEQEQNRTMYQILEPYLWKMVEGTGNIANQAGKGLFEALKIGANWVYDKLTNNVVPYAVENIPKLVFIIKNGTTQKKYISSDAFQVLQIQDDQYNEIRKNKNTGKKRVVIPLKGESDQKLIKMLEKENYVPGLSLPEDVGEQGDQESYMIPSANFMVHHEQIKKKHEAEYQKSKQMEVTEDKETNQEFHGYGDSQLYNPQIYYQNLDQFNQPKKYLKLKDCLIFEYEGKNSIEYDLLDNIERDENTQFGYLVQPKQMIKSTISDDSDQPYSGEAPLLAVQSKKQELPIRRVKVQIPKQKLEQKQEQSEEKQVYYA